MTTELPAPLVGPIRERLERAGESQTGATPSSTGVKPWRGLLVDCSRTFYPVETIERVLTVMARYGFNRFHWHLTDNSGWRLEIPGYPRLSSVASRLERFPFDDYVGSTKEEVIRRAQEQAPKRWRNGIYTDEDVRRVLNFAASLGIQVIPEIDLPGHMGAAIVAYPELGNPRLNPEREGGPDPQAAVVRGGAGRAGGVRNDLLWPTEESLTFIRAVLDHVCELFDAPYLHLGGDECEFRLWEADPDLRPWMDERGIEDVRGIQTWFMRQAAEYVRERGKTPVAWDEVAGVDPQGDYLVIGWEGQAAMERLAASEQPYIYADLRWLYLNYGDPEGPADQLGFFPPIGVDDILNATWPETNSPRCVGIQACLWTEFVLDEAELWSLLLPRLLAVAERIWDPAGTDRASARQRVEQEARVLDELGIVPAEVRRR